MSSQDRPQIQPSLAYHNSLSEEDWTLFLNEAQLTFESLDPQNQAKFPVERLIRNKNFLDEFEVKRRARRLAFQRTARRGAVQSVARRHL